LILDIFSELQRAQPGNDLEQTLLVDAIAQAKLADEVGLGWVLIPQLYGAAPGA
jgi:hypothetical protein